MIRAAALLFIVIVAIITAPIWFFALAALSPTLLAIVILFVIGIPVAVLWMTFIEPVFDIKIRRPLDAAWANALRKLGRLARRNREDGT